MNKKCVWDKRQVVIETPQAVKTVGSQWSGAEILSLSRPADLIMSKDITVNMTAVRYPNGQNSQ